MRRYIKNTPPTIFSQGFFFLGLPSNKYRDIISYAATSTPSRGPLTPLPKSISDMQKVLHYWSSIYYHAECRVKLFFLLCIFYHNKKLTLLTAKTDLQHGKGSATKDLVGCHSSLFPKLSECPQNEFLPKKKSLLKNTQFYHDNNMTVCLPALVNATDRFFEGHHGNSLYRKAALQVLNHISQGLLTPTQGLRCFLRILKKAFSEKNNFISNSENLESRRNIYRIIFEIQKKGTFDPVLKGNRLKYNYIYSLLKKRPGESTREMYERAQLEIANTPYIAKRISQKKPDFSYSSSPKNNTPVEKTKNRPLA